MSAANHDRNGRPLTRGHHTILYDEVGDPMDLATVMRAEGETCLVAVRVPNARLEVTVEEEGLTWGDVQEGQMVRLQEGGAPVQKCIGGVAYERFRSGGLERNIPDAAPVAEVIPEGEEMAAVRAYLQRKHRQAVEGRDGA